QGPIADDDEERGSFVVGFGSPHCLSVHLAVHCPWLLRTCTRETNSRFPNHPRPRSGGIKSSALAVLLPLRSTNSEPPDSSSHTFQTGQDVPSSYLHK
ncbi:hypothetical protein BT69DRAFT_1276228, partial [Atractiella rhizophila]